jgi:ABC-type transport system involved in multi-copper enzyme maturation permease subunit
MMMLSLLKFEWQFHSRQLVFYIALFACVSFSAILMLSQSVDSDILVTGPYHLARIICTVAHLMLPFLVSAFAGNAIVRDCNAKIAELVFSSKISKWHYFFSRWLGLVLISCLLFLTVCVGMLIGVTLLDNVQFSILQTLAAILWPILLLAVPGIILLATILFAVGLFSNKNIAIYITAILFFFGYQLLLVKTGSVLMANPASGSDTLQFIFSLLDPFGSAAFFDQVKLWSPAEKNAQFFQLSEMLLINRLMVLVISLVILLFCYFVIKSSALKSVKALKRKVLTIKRLNHLSRLKPCNIIRQ